MVVLSLFDGMSCGQIALKNLGIIPERYYASEIDKHTIKQTQVNFPNTIQLGDITKWKDWDIDWSKIDLVLAGSPCQGFSFAGKQLAFDDPRSKLFFVFIEILDYIQRLNPYVYFLLENVRMKKEWQHIISKYCGVEPVNINSNLVSAQNRNRFYWTNIKTKEQDGNIYSDIPQPEDKGIFLRDILEEKVLDKYYVSQAVINRLSNPHKHFKPKINPDKTGCLTTKNNSGQMSFDSGTTFISIEGESPTQRSSTGRCLDRKHNYQFIKIKRNGKISKDQDKASCFTAGENSEGNHSDMDLIYVAIRGREQKCLVPKELNIKKKNVQSLEPLNDGKTNCLTSVQKDNLICKRKVIQLNESIERGGKQPYQQNRVYDINGISPALCAEMSCGSHAICADIIRRLTPTECARLQTVPDWYIWECSDTQIYKMCGNGWTIDVISHILSFI